MYHVFSAAGDKSKTVTCTRARGTDCVNRVVEAKAKDRRTPSEGGSEAKEGEGRKGSLK